MKEISKTLSLYTTHKLQVRMYRVQQIIDVHTHTQREKERKRGRGREGGDEVKMVGPI